MTESEKERYEYYKNKAEKLEEEKASNEQISGIAGLIFAIVSLIVISYLKYH